MSEWQSCKSEMPVKGALYWLTNGDSYAIGKWSIENAHWIFLFHGSVFIAKWMLRIELPEPPK